MKNLENVKALNDMEMAKVAGGNFFADLEEVLRQIFADKKPTQQNNPTSPERLMPPWKMLIPASADKSCF